MAIDLNRVIQATADAVLEGQGSGSQPSQGSDKGQKHGLSVPRAFLIGAGVVTAGRLVAGARGRGMLENLQERLLDYEHRHFDGADAEEVGEHEEEPEGEEDEDFDDEAEDDEPEAEEDEDFDDEAEDDEPEAEEDEDFDDEEEESEERPRRRRARSGSGGRR